MITQVKVAEAFVPVSRLEALLEEAGCIKTTRSTETVCIWRAPKGRRFSAPNPKTTGLVPKQAYEQLILLLESLGKLPEVTDDKDRAPDIGKINSPKVSSSTS